MQSTRISRKSRSGAKPELSSREGGIFCAGWGARRGALGLIALVRRDRGPRAQAAVGTFVGLGLGPSQGFISVLLFCASSAGARAQPAAREQRARRCAGRSVGVGEREGTGPCSLLQAVAMDVAGAAGGMAVRGQRTASAGGIHAGWKCGDAFRPPARPT